MLADGFVVESIAIINPNFAGLAIAVEDRCRNPASVRMEGIRCVDGRGDRTRLGLDDRKTSRPLLPFRAWKCQLDLDCEIILIHTNSPIAAKPTTLYRNDPASLGYLDSIAPRCR
jgi:hypothetical protein